MKIQIFIDTICGWCFIGSQRLQSVLHKLRDDYEIIYVPFQLNPHMPLEGMNRVDYVTSKFGSIENAQDMYDNMVQQAKQENLQFKLEKIKRTPNTVLSHILIDLARHTNKQKEIVFEIFSNYFIEGMDIGDMNNLIKIGTNHGIKKDMLISEFQSKKSREKVERMDTIGRKMGITGVPFYVFNEKILISGAQPQDALLKAIEDSK